MCLCWYSHEKFRGPEIYLDDSKLGVVSEGQVWQLMNIQTMWRLK